MLKNILGGEIKFLINLNLSKTKIMILEFLISKQPSNILEIQKGLTKKFGLKKSFNYKTIWQHVKELEKDSLVIIQKENQMTGKPNKIYLSPLINENKDNFLFYSNLILNDSNLSLMKKNIKDKNKQFLKELEKEKN